MNTNQNIPEEDLILSQKLHQFLTSDLVPSELNDPLANLLFDFKRQEKIELQNLEMNSILVWNNILNVINQPAENRLTVLGNHAIHQLSINKLIWKIAAVVLVTFIASLFLSQNQRQTAIEIARAGTTIETIVLKDGSEAILRPNSVLYSINTDDSKQSYRLDGEAIFSVVSNPDRQFIVETVLGSAEVLGTRFNIRTWQNETLVYLESGSLRLRTTDQKNETLLRPGELSVITSQSEITGPKSGNSEHYTSWQMNEIIFNNRSAKSIFKEIEHHFSIDIQAPEEINQTVLGGSVSLQNLESSLQNLGLALEGEFILIENNRYRFHGF